MKKVFLTGITGLLGANTALKLLDEGYFVIALLRDKSRYFGKKNENLKLIEGDLFSDVSVFLEDVEIVIHIAAETRQNLYDYENYKKINRDATAHLFSHCEKAYVKKFLFVSTANTLGFGNLNKPGNEKNPQKYPFTDSLYAKSKLEAENFLLKNHKTTEVLILNPTFMIGAHDYKPSSGKIIFWVWKKRLVFYPTGGKSFVHVEDVANAILKAITKGKNGEKYIITNENLKYKVFFRKINDITGQRPVMFPIPDFILKIAGFAGDILRFFKIKTSLGSVNMKILKIDNFYSNRKSVNDLGIVYQPIEKAVEDAVCFFQKIKK